MTIRLMPKRPSQKGKTLGERLLDELEPKVGSRAQERVARWLKDKHGIQISGAMINKYKNNDDTPRGTMGRELAVAAGVQVEWLLTGRGEKHPMERLSDDEHEVIQLLRSMDAADRMNWIGHLRIEVARLRDKPKKSKRRGRNEAA